MKCFLQCGWRLFSSVLFAAVVIVVLLFSDRRWFCLDPVRSGWVSSDVELYYPFNDLHFNNEDWCLYLVLLADEKEGFARVIPPGVVLKTCDIGVLRRLRSTPFHYTGADICTLGGMLQIYQGRRLVFDADVAIDGSHVLLQNSHFGYIEEFGKSMVLEFEKFAEVSEADWSRKFRESQSIGPTQEQIVFT